MSRAAVEAVQDLEHIEANGGRILARLRGAFLRKGIAVRGNMFVHALEELTRPKPEPPLDAGWPRTNLVNGEVNR